MTELVTRDTLQEYENFIAGHPKGHFMQSSLWAAQKPSWQWTAVLARGGDGAITGTLAVLTRKVPGLPLTIMYGCRGPVCDPADHQTLAALIEGAKALAKKRRSYVLKLDPDIPSDNAGFLSFMLSLGFSAPSSGKNFEGIQPRYVFRLRLEGRDEETLLAGFESKTRYNIRLAVRKGVVTKLCGQEAVGDFAALMRDTGLRDGFVTRGADYFSSMLRNLGEHARLYMAYYNEIPVAGTLAVWFGDKVWYLYGASSNEYRNLMPNYLLQWEMIRWAVEKNCRIYDFRGVSGDLSEDNPLYGLYRFKKGFNGDFVEFIGELDYVISPAAHFLVEKGQRAFRHGRKILYLLKNRDHSGQNTK